MIINYCKILVTKDVRKTRIRGSVTQLPVESWQTEAESKENMVYGTLPMPELTIASHYVHSRVDSNTFTMGIGQPYARVDFIPQSGTMDFASGDNLRCSTVQYCEFPLAEDKKKPESSYCSVRPFKKY